MQKPTKAEAQAAVKLILEYIGEDTSREGLQETPARVIKSYDELFVGYSQKIGNILNKQFQDICEYNDVVLLRSINFTSICEHHMLPFFGTVDIAYLPDGVVLGISKLARLVDIFSKRLQIQERLTSNIALALQEHLQPKGVAVRVRASHSCMTARGIFKVGSILESSHFTGIYHEQQNMRAEFWEMLKN
ncbi:MAG: GTP cyclohydrolase I FolE [Rickettsiaceae bacterium]